MRHIPEDERKQRNKIESEPHHDAEAEKQWTDIRHGTRRRLGDGRGVGSTRISDKTLEQERIAEIGGVFVKLRQCGRVVPICFQALQGVVGDKPAADALLRVRD